MRLSDPAFRALFEDAPIGIVVVDAGLRVVDVNAAYCDMLGYTEAEMMRRSIPDVTHPDDRGRDAAFMVELLAGRVPRYRAEKRYLAKSGEVVWARITVTPLLEQSREIKHVFSMAQPLAEHRALAKLLPMCAVCHKVRPPSGGWVKVETYLRESEDAVVKDDRCPDCAR